MLPEQKPDQLKEVNKSQVALSEAVRNLGNVLLAAVTQPTPNAISKGSNNEVK